VTARSVKTARPAPKTALVRAVVSASTTFAKIPPRIAATTRATAAKTAKTARVIANAPQDKTAMRASAKPLSKTAEMALAKQTKAKTAQRAPLIVDVRTAKPVKTMLVSLLKAAETARAIMANTAGLALLIANARAVSPAKTTFAPLHKTAEMALAKQTKAKTVQRAPLIVDVRAAKLAKTTFVSLHKIAETALVKQTKASIAALALRIANARAVNLAKTTLAPPPSPRSPALSKNKPKNATWKAKTAQRFASNPKQAALANPTPKIPSNSPSLYSLSSLSGSTSDDASPNIP